MKNTKYLEASDLMVVIRKVRAPFGAKIKVRKGKSVKAPNKSVIIIAKEGGKKMARPGRKAAGKARAMPKRKTIIIKGQHGNILVQGSDYGVARQPDVFRIGKLPTAPRVITAEQRQQEINARRRRARR